MNEFREDIEFLISHVSMVFIPSKYILFPVLHYVSYFKCSKSFTSGSH